EMIRRVDEVAHRVAPTGHLFGVLRRAAPVAAAPAAKAAAAESAAAASPPTVAAAAVVAPSGTPIAVAVRLAIALIGVERPSSGDRRRMDRSEEHTSELQSRFDLVCRLLLEKKKKGTERQTLDV